MKNVAWNKVKVGSLCTRVTSGGTPKSTNAEYYDNGKIPWLNSKEVNFSHIYSTEKFITEKGLAESSAKWIEKNSVIVAMYGATAGQVAIAKIPLTTNQACCNLTIDDKLADYRYVYYYLWNQYQVLSGLANGGAQQNLNAQIIKEFEIQLPELSVQKSISEILFSLDEQIRINNTINHNLEEQIRVLFEDFFINSQHCANWKQGTIADLGNVVGGSTPSKAKPEYYTSNGIAWITPKDLSGNKSKFISKGESDITPAGLRNSSAVIMPRGTVLFSSRAPIGYIAIAKNEITTNQGFKSVVPHLHIGTAFVYCFLKHNLPKIESMASGSTFKEVSGSVMKAIPAVIPAKEALMNFSTITQPLFDQQELLESENQRLTRLRDALLPKLMSGEIDVSEVEI